MLRETGPGQRTRVPSAQITTNPSFFFLALVITLISIARNGTFKTLVSSLASGFTSKILHCHTLFIYMAFVLNVGTGTWDGPQSTLPTPGEEMCRFYQVVAFLYCRLRRTILARGRALPHCLVRSCRAVCYCTVLERLDDIAKLQVLSIMAQTCMQHSRIRQLWIRPILGYEPGFWEEGYSNCFILYVIYSLEIRLESI